MLDNPLELIDVLMHPNHIPDLSSFVSSDKVREAREGIADVLDNGSARQEEKRKIIGRTDGRSVCEVSCCWSASLL